MALSRIQSFEINDHPRAPSSLRETIVEALSRTLAWGRMLSGLVEPFERFIAASGASEVLDLGAGAGGPASILAREIRRAGRTPPRFLLTDLHPRLAAWQKLRDEHPEDVDFAPDPVDATSIPEALAAGRARTIINVFHHFPPELARSILADAVAGSQGVLIAECFERNPLQYLNFGFAGAPALLASPLLTERDRLLKALWCWATPVAVAAALWDGVVSTLRVYSEEELRAMVAGLGSRFRWEYVTYRYPPFGTGYVFFGVPDR